MPNVATAKQTWPLYKCLLGLVSTLSIAQVGYWPEGDSSSRLIQNGGWSVIADFNDEDLSDWRSWPSTDGSLNDDGVLSVVEDPGRDWWNNVLKVDPSVLTSGEGGPLYFTLRFPVGVEVVENGSPSIVHYRIFEESADFGIFPADQYFGVTDQATLGEDYASAPTSAYYSAQTNIR